MNTFRAISYLCPLLLALILPAILAWRRMAGKGAFNTIVWGKSAFSAISFLTLGVWIFSGDTFWTWVQVFFLAGALALFIGAIYLFLDSLRVPPAAAQVFSTLLGIALVASTFALGPIIRNAQSTAMPGEQIVQRINTVLTVSPYTITGQAIFEDDVVRRPILYRTDAADYPFAIPSFWNSMLGYELIGFFFFGIACFIYYRQYRRSKAPPPSDPSPSP